MGINPQITNTLIGREYGWDHVSDADPALLHQNRECAMNVLLNPDRFPRADFAALEEMIAAIDNFLIAHSEVLNLRQ